MYDIAVLGGGPAGLSAALTARARGKTVAVLSNNPEQSPLWRAVTIENYPGLPGASGEALITAMTEQARAAGTEFIKCRVNGIVDTGDGFMLSAGAEFYEAKTVILATGVVSAAKFPGEQEYLGSGVSYCATCDGMLYKGKKVAVIGRSSDAPEEANALFEIGVKVFYTGLTAERPAHLSQDITYIPAKRVSIEGGQSAEAVVLDGERYDAEGVFILRETMAPTAIFPELAMENGYIGTGRDMKTSVSGVFAAGDCTGKPLQIAKAVGEGLIAALSAVEYLSKK